MYDSANSILLFFFYYCDDTTIKTLEFAIPTNSNIIKSQNVSSIFISEILFTSHRKPTTLHQNNKIINSLHVRLIFLLFYLLVWKASGNVSKESLLALDFVTFIVAIEYIEDIECSPIVRGIFYIQIYTSNFLHVFIKICINIYNHVEIYKKYQNRYRFLLTAIQRLSEETKLVGCFFYIYFYTLVIFFSRHISMGCIFLDIFLQSSIFILTYFNMVAFFHILTKFSMTLYGCYVLFFIPFL